MLAGTFGGTGLAAAGFLVLLAVGEAPRGAADPRRRLRAGPIAPSIFIGAALGGAVGHTAQVLVPDATIQPGALALAGMAAVMATSNRAPLTSILIVFELTGDYDMVVPLMLASASPRSSRTASTHESIYTLPLRAAASSTASRRTSTSCRPSGSARS
jgi:chloride channel protein, CIC family